MFVMLLLCVCSLNFRREKNTLELFNRRVKEGKENERRGIYLDLLCLKIGYHSNNMCVSRLVYE